MQLKYNGGQRNRNEMKWTQFNVTVAALLLMAGSGFAQRQMEVLGRGVIAVRISATQAYVGWRQLGTDPDDVSFNLYRVRSGVTNKLNGTPLTTSCNYLDTPPNFSVANEYFVRPIVGGIEQAPSAGWVLPANAPTQQYVNLALNPPAGGTAADGVPYTYNANDCSAGDADGDGEYEIFLKWDPSNSHDNAHSGFTGNVFIDAYKLDGTRLWRIDLGQNIRAGAHYTQFMVFDLDGDGRAELACKTAPGTRDGLGTYVDGNAGFTVYTNSSGYILSGPEYFTIFDGLTGANLATTNYVPARGNVSDWGDNYGNRVDRFLAGIAYLDGVRPSVVMCRGYYTRTALAAWDWRNGQLTQRWVFDTGHSGGPWSAYKGQGNHQLSVADVDADGRDEIVYGACTINDDGTGLYTMGLGHGDALHVSDLDPSRPGYERWGIHETANTPGSALTATANGQILWLTPNADVGRGVAADLTAAFPGAEVWGGTSGLRSIDNQSAGSEPGPDNFAIWWDADLLRELEDGTAISKYGGGNLLAPAGLSSNNGTKSTPGLSADLFGDWREEVIWRTADNLNLRIYTTTVLATNRFSTLMHDPQYRCAIAWQNVAYNQPPHPGFYIGPGMSPPPRAPISNAQLAWRGGAGGNSWTAANNWFTNGGWTTNGVTTYAPGDSVLFDLRGGNNAVVSISGVVTPGDVTVHSPSNYTFSGAGSLTGAAKLFKAGPGRLTISTTNTYSGGTLVSGGQLIINGVLAASPVVVEARGEPWGRAKIGGSGRLGQGLTVQRECGVIVGPGTNVAGTLTITNGLTEQGGVLNQFDLSNNPGGANNDRIAVLGNLSLTGTNVIEITQLNGFLGAGVYPLITYTGALAGGLSNLSLRGDFFQDVELTNPPGMIALAVTVPAAPPAAPSGLTAAAVGAFQINLAWTDNAPDEIAFSIQRAAGGPTNFTPIATVPLNTTMYQDVGLTPNTTYFYRVAATNLAGFSASSNTNSATTAALPPLLTWRGDGTNNAWDLVTSANWHDGNSLVVYNDTTDVLIDQTGSNNTAISLVGLLQPGAVTVAAGKNYTFGGAGALAGDMALTKSGAGNLTLGNAGGNSFTGGVIINAGTLTLGASNTIGAGPVTLRSNATLVLGTYSLSAANPLSISGTPSLTGGNGGGLTDLHAVNGAGVVAVTVTTGVLDLQGDLSGFNGTFAFTGGNSVRFYGSTGSANTTFDLGPGTLFLNKRSGVGTITLGALAGGPNTTLQGASGGNNSTATTYVIGGKNLDTTFAGKIINGQGTTGITKVGSGTLTLTGSNDFTGTTIVTAGVLRINGDHSAAPGNVIVNGGGTLGGIGIIGGPISVTGALAPGAGLGTLTFRSGLTLAPSSTTRMEISLSPRSNDLVVVSGSLAVNGTLQVLNTSIETPVAGDKFQLFGTGNYTGAFAAFDLPVLDEGLIWNTSRLSADGTLWVVSTNPPAFTAVTRVGSQLQLAGSGGTPGWEYHVLSSPNLLLPRDAWLPVATNQFDGSGEFLFSVPVEAGVSQRYFRISVP